MEYFRCVANDASVVGWDKTGLGRRKLNTLYFSMNHIYGSQRAKGIPGEMP